MAIRAGGAPEGGRGFGPVKSREIREIEDDIIDEIRYAADVQRNADSIKLSDNFHLDALLMRGGQWGGYYKVDIQRRRGNKVTVAQAMVQDGVNSYTEVQEALRNSLGDGQKWIVTA